MTKEIFKKHYLYAHMEEPVTKMIVAVRLPSGATEIIINTDDIQSKYDYYLNAYDDEMRLKNNQNVQIVRAMFV